jgi:Xaa-Pro aminopeptidase
MADAGPKFIAEPKDWRLLEAKAEGKEVKASWQGTLNGSPLVVRSAVQLWQKSLVVDCFCTGGMATEISFVRIEGAENPEDTIFSIGRDAGIGHSSGTPTDEITLGKPICFDIYPCEKGGGYFYDFTRTWCLGYAPEDVQQLYNQVRLVYDTVVKALKPGGLCVEYQKMTCDMFEEMGHPTIQSNPNTEDGYNHSLGHGLGLNVHEKPWFGVLAGSDDVLEPGMVFTIEPGLYYPEKGMGVRIEDTFYVDEDGSIQICVKYPYDLVLPMKG